MFHITLGPLLEASSFSSVFFPFYFSYSSSTHFPLVLLLLSPLPLLPPIFSLPLLLPHSSSFFSSPPSPFFRLPPSTGCTQENIRRSPRLQKPKVCTGENGTLNAVEDISSCVSIVFPSISPGRAGRLH